VKNEVREDFCKTLLYFSFSSVSSPKSSQNNFLNFFTCHILLFD